jgi:hypothetical protein
MSKTPSKFHLRPDGKPYRDHEGNPMRADQFENDPEPFDASVENMSDEEVQGWFDRTRKPQKK